MALSRFGTIGRALASLAAVACLAALAILAGCNGRGFEQDYLEPSNNEREPARYTSEVQRDTVFGQGGFDILSPFFGSKDEPGAGAGGGGIGVNSFLWRASLDTISFMPLSSADPFGGVIITDWYTPPEAPAERFKMNVYILGRQLRADGIRVAVFRQAKSRTGQWSDASVRTETSVNLEDQILTRARQLRVASATAR